MSKFLRIIKESAPDLTKSDKTLLKMFNTDYVEGVRIIDKDDLKVTLKGGDEVFLRVTNYTTSDTHEEDNEALTKMQGLTPNEEIALKVATSSGIQPKAGYFGLGRDPLKKIGTSLGKLYGKLAGEIEKVANKI